MLKPKITLVVLLFCILTNTKVFGQLRSFDDLFPGIEESKRSLIFSASGTASRIDKPTEINLVPGEKLTSNLLGPIIKGGHTVLMEVIRLIPYSSKTISLVDVYNSVNNVRSLQGRLYSSHSRGEDVPLFEDATRIESERRLSSTIEDPPYTNILPAEEVAFLRLKDVNFGNSYYRTDTTIGKNGMLYELVNFKSLSYVVVPVIREGKFVAKLYIEPIAEGLLIYGMAGADVSNLISSRIDIPSAIRKRVMVIIDWIIEGVSG